MRTALVRVDPRQQHFIPRPILRAPAAAECLPLVHGVDRPGGEDVGEVFARGGRVGGAVPSIAKFS